MKIAIFGDSYAIEYYNPKELMPWPSIIRQQENHLEIDNFSKGGSSFYYSVAEFFKNYSLYDKVIFIVARPGRLWLPNNPEYPHINNIKNCELRAAASSSLAEKTLMNSAKNYLRDVQNIDEEIFKHHCMFEKIKSIRDNILFLPVDRVSIPDYKGTVLCDIASIDTNYYKPKDYWLKKDVRCCHMNQENNKILANRVLSWLKGREFVFDIDDYKLPTEKESDIWEGEIYI